MPTSGSLLFVSLGIGLAQACLGLVVENAGEWLFHRYVLHGLGRHPDSVWHYHWSEHHRLSWQHNMLDPGYRDWPLRWNTQGKEVLLLGLIVAVHTPLLEFVPCYVLGLYAGLAVYYVRHRRSHLDPGWARHHLPWHYEHHLGGNVDANWCISWPWFDWFMGTRVRSGKA